ncbi:hypothetical protein Droror1_Dr00020181 [Drosera rotundifolia]
MTGMMDLYRKLRFLKAQLRRLNREEFSDLSERVERARWDLLRAQDDLLSGVWDPGRGGLERDVGVRLIKLARMEESMLRQKARIGWLELGDRNTAFFFSSVRSRQNRGGVRSLISDDGRAIRCQEELMAEARGYFGSLLFAAPRVAGLRDDQGIWDPGRGGFERDVGVRLIMLARMEESMLRQKACIGWLELGDRNTTFFISSVRSRKNRGGVRSLISDDGRAIRCQEELIAEARGYFGSLLFAAPRVAGLRDDQHPRFGEIVAQSWNVEVHGTPMFSLYRKLRFLKAQLRRLNREEFSDLSERVERAHWDLLRAQDDLLLGVWDPGRGGLERDVGVRLIILARMEESMLRQKARIGWLELGDRNTAFFFARAKSSNRGGVRSLISDDGRAIRCQEELTAEARGYFGSLLFAAPRVAGLRDDQGIWDPGRGGLERDVGVRLIMLARMEESMLWQKACIGWLELGDRNTAFFFSSVRSRQNRGGVRSLISDDGRAIRCQEELMA